MQFVNEGMKGFKEKMPQRIFENKFNCDYSIMMECKVDLFHT